MTDHRKITLPYTDCHMITDRLWMGGMPTGIPKLFEKWDVIVFCAGEYQPHVELPENRNKSIMRVPFDDSANAINNSVAAELHKRAKQLAQMHAEGKNILITCFAGVNRSGLLTALTLRYAFGCDGDEAIYTIQAIRTFALSNKAFCHYIRTTSCT
jgi:protein-tyrosine phosphatase